MKPRSLLLAVAFLVSIVAGGYHWRSHATLSRLEAESARVLREATEQNRRADETSQQVAKARNAQAVQVAQTKPIAPATSPGSRAPAPPAPPPPPSAEMRGWQVQAYVSDQQLRFARLFKQLGFTAENRQAFARIQAAFREASLDPAQSATARQQARQVHDAALKELFGTNYDQWVASSREEPARNVVETVVRQTFQSSGSLTTAQADELTRIVAQNRGRSGSYDWDKISADAEGILANQQREDFIAAIAYCRASEKMSALRSKKKS